jgi:Tfp pilus assembly protein PilX
MRYNTISMMRKIPKSRVREAGIASFMIVMIMIIVITLIVLGFSQVTRRNVREALDRQLSSQAFYAAESGVNVTAAAISNYVKANGFTALPDKTTCPKSYDPTQPGGLGSAVADLGNATRYTCVLVNPNPDTLVYNPTRQGSIVVPIQTTGSVALNTLTFTWQVQSGGTNTACGGGSQQTFPAASAWPCDFGILRVDMVANPASGVSNLPVNTVTTFMTPLGGHSGAITLPNFSSGDRAFVASASGCGSGTCSVTVNLAANATPNYYLRIISLYRDAPNMTIRGTLVGGGTATFSGAQALVDTTGQAQDELRRIQVRVQLSATADSATIPANGVGSSATICKRFSIKPTDSVDPANLCT